MLPNNTVCALPWTSIEVTSGGNFRPCCLANENLTHQGRVLHAADTISVAYRSDSLQNLRQQFLDGKKPKTCSRCWDEEAVGKTSKRMRHLQKYQSKKQLDKINWSVDADNQLWFLDFKLGNICNLKCRICGPWSSSRWAQEFIEQEHDGKHKKHTVAYIEQKQKEWPRDTPSFWQDLETILPHATEFEFTGGEPFLIKEHFDVLSRAVELGVAHRLSLHYNTNGTVWPDQAEVWQHFNIVEIAFSIDNLGEKFELERSGAKWEQLLHTIDCAKQFQSIKRILLQACVTVSAHNVLDLPEICQWLDTQPFDSVYFNLLHDPWHFNIGRMTDTAKLQALEKITTLFNHKKFGNDFRQIAAYMQAGTSTDGQEFCKVTEKVDKIRGENFTTTHSNIARAMGYGS